MALGILGLYEETAKRPMLVLCAPVQVVAEKVLRSQAPTAREAGLWCKY